MSSTITPLHLKSILSNEFKKNILYKYVLLKIFNDYEKIYIPLESYDRIITDESDFYIYIDPSEIMNILKSLLIDNGFEFKHSNDYTEIYFESNFIDKFHSGLNEQLREEQCSVIIITYHLYRIQEKLENNLDDYFNENFDKTLVKRLSKYSGQNISFESGVWVNKGNKDDKFYITSYRYESAIMSDYKPIYEHGNKNEFTYMTTLYPDQNFIYFFYEYCKSKQDRKFKITNITV